MDAVVVLGVYLLAWQSWWVAEDAYISFRYAHRLAEGLGLSFNSVDAPVEGFSNPLWVLIAAVLVRAGAELTEVMPHLSVAMGAATLVSARRTAVGELEMSPVTSLFAVLLAALAAPTVCWSSSGLETMCFASLFWLCASVMAFGEGRWAVVTGGALALGLALIRTEGVAWMVVLAALASALRWRESRPLGAVAAMAGIGLAGFSVWFGWKYSYYGDWMSTVARAKVSLGGGVWLRGIRYSAAWHLISLWPLLVPLGVMAGWRDPGRRWRACWVGCLAVAAPVWAALVGGDYMEHFRFIVPSVLPAALAVGWLFQAALRVRPSAGWVGAVVTLGLAHAPVHDVVVLPQGLLRTVAVRSTSQGSELSYRGGLFRSQVAPLGSRRNLYLESQAIALLTSPGDRVVTGAIGMIGYFNPDLTILDLCGLVSPKVSARRVVVKASDRPGHEKCTGPQFFMDAQPDLWGVVVVSGPSPAELAQELRGRVAQWRTFDALDRFAPHLVELRDPAGGGVAFAAGMKAVDTSRHGVTWERFETAVDALAEGRSETQLCVRALEKVRGGPPHRGALKAVVARDGRDCGGQSLAAWLASQRL